ncbi:SRPBCC family protein [Amycolatopsis sp. FDAARGOS 1241]|uniref:SRPBCC family protein n=1 Tax=Amycolatopsis sp. FDAARGOS 1241 TaxID=2778070 RepID=UPI0019508B83|nr:SRPBCC family protein [Amycolatopsis sp. FDAARGOS 1241]QRP50366.1 SRPBCC family protein [Amycolatopsis sp. FDAARGOS 1241]
MKLENTFEVPLPIDETWRLLQDLRKVAPCLPGAHLDDVVEGEYRGGLSTKIGPITAKYRGNARFLERDELDHRAVIQARGREERGSGTAAATITATLRATGSGTRVDLVTDMAISGRAAQFGRSLIAEVSATLIAEFAGRLKGLITGAGAPEPAQLDVARTVVVPLGRKALVPGIAGVVAGVLGWLLGRRAARSG